MTGLLRLAWNAPGAAPRPPRRVWRDWAVLLLVVAAAALEAAFRSDLAHPLTAALLALAAAPTLLWRRTRPLLMLVISFSVMASAMLLLDGAVLYTSVFAILNLYALVRWGSGRALIIGAGIILGNLVASALIERSLGDLVGEIAFTVIVVSLGLAVRFRASIRRRELDRVKALEREMLARDLHDTVAHHVSAIAIRAQAGLATAALNPDAATDALLVIEAEASKTLAEMRGIVGVLRQGTEPELAPGRTLIDIADLASADHAAPRVDVQVTGALDSIPPTVAAAVYRLAQESVTNARRHSRNATLIDVRVEADSGGVRLTVANDGDVAPAAAPGYGIIGMIERASLLGGTCHSGRAPGGGWVVTAVLPRVGWAT
ncbi:sensor histidine kinase [Ruicaihuangia caeni]|uniref:sensor histidine kinase n=1 Tax=Ruicaihuangia caeni TaxID=3042517 RepID=UPI00338FD7E4